VQRRPLFAGLSFAIAAAGLLLAAGSSAWIVVGAGLICHVLMTIYSTVLHIYGAEIFPTAIRGSAAGGAYAGNRIGGAMVPLVLLPVLLNFGPLIMLCVVAVVLTGAGIIALLFGPKGRAGQGLG
jgi:putative MFS transporter